MQLYQFSPQDTNSLEHRQRRRKLYRARKQEKSALLSSILRHLPLLVIRRGVEKREHTV